MKAIRQVRIRRALALIIHWEPGHLEICNYLSGKVSRISPDLVPLLNALEDYVSLASLTRESASSLLLLRRLLANDILVREGSQLAAREEALFSRWDWGIAAKHFHFATNSIPFETNDESIWRTLELKSRSIPPPSPFRELGGKYTRLPEPKSISMDLRQAMMLRRTCRSFRRTPIELGQLATILGLTWGVSATSSSGQSLGDFVLKTSPSGGARHPTEVFVFASRVRGLKPGIYHYSPRLHALCQIRSGNPADLARALCAKQSWVGNAAVTFFMTALVSRTMWKYGHSHAYRVLLLDAGHLGQTFHLVCTALGLGPFTTAAIDGSGVENTLGIDGIDEIVIYAAAAGWPKVERTAFESGVASGAIQK